MWFTRYFLLDFSYASMLVTISMYTTKTISLFVFINFTELHAYKY